MSGKPDVELGKASIDTANGYVSKRAQKPAPDETLAEYDSSDSEDELPITANRHARWWYSIFHNITAMIGAGVLGLPQAFKYLGWTGGTITLVLSFLISLWNLRQLCSMHEINGKRMNRYHELGQYAFGQRAGLWAVVPFQLIVMIGLGITYSVTAGKSLQAVYLMCGGSGHVGLSVWIIVFAISELFASQLPNFNSLAFVSLVAAVMSVTYSTIGWTTAVADGRIPDVQYNLDGVSRLEGIMGCFNALGTIAFAYGGHNVVLEIQATLPKNISVEGGTFKFSRSLSSANTLHEAAELGNIDKLQQFVDAGKEMGYPARETLRKRDALVGATCLHYAAEHGRAECAKWLLDNDVEIYAADHAGVTPLHLACLKGHLEVVSLLLNQGCGTETRDNEGDTAMHWAATKGHTEVMQMLRQFGAQVDVTNKADWTALHRAAYCGFSETCEWLLNNAVSMHAVNKEGNTALHLACQSNQLKVIEVLLQWGARANMTNASGFAPVDMTGLDAVQAVMEEFAPDTPKRRTLQERKAMLAKGKRWSFLRKDIAPTSVASDSNKQPKPAVRRRTSDGFPMGLTDSPMRIDHPTIYEDDEEDTSIFNMGIALDAAGTDAMFNFGVNPNPGGTAGSTFTTHQQQQAEQELAEKQMSQLQVNDLSPQRATMGATEMKIRVLRRSTRDPPLSSRDSTSTRTSNKSDMTPWSDEDTSKRTYTRGKMTGSFNVR